MNEENKEIDRLKERLRVAEDTLNAIKNGKVDALVIQGAKGEQLYSINSPDHPYQVFFENMDEAAIVLSNQHIILYGNRSFFEMLGMSCENVIGKSIFNFLKQSDHRYFIDHVLKNKKTKGELCINSFHQGSRTVLASIFKGIWNESDAQCLLFTDITELKRIQHFIETSHSVARILSEVSTLSVAAKSIIELLCNRLGWEVMIIWIWNSEKQVLQCLEIAHIDGLDIEEFEKKSREMGSETKQLFSHICLSNRPIWIKDFADHYNLVRRNEAVRNNLHGALAFPFNKDSQVGGVIELFRRIPFEGGVDNLQFDLLWSIGIDLGFYIQRLLSDHKRNEIAKALELSVNAIYTTDLKGTLSSWNDGAEKMYGWLAQEMIGSNINKLYPPEKSDKYKKKFEAFLLGMPVKKFESQRLRKDGELIWVAQSYDKTYDLFGAPSGVIIVEQEITPEKEWAKYLADSEKKFNSFIEITEDWIWELDSKGNFQFSNCAVYEFLGFEVDEILGKSLLYFVPVEERERIQNQMREIQTKKIGWRRLIIPFVHKNGSCRWIESNAKELLDDEGYLVGFRGTSRNITELRNLDKIKNEFISVVSHELRTPLTSISGALNLLIAKKISPEESDQLICIAHKNAVRLSKIINDTMDIEKLQIGKLTLDLKKINLADVVREAVFSHDMIGNKFNIKLILGDSLPFAQIMGDYCRLIQVMNNLLSNAIKFSPNQGTVVVSLEVRDHCARVLVTDKGPGIPRDFQSKIFGSFAQADSSIKREVTGAGLGLYISKSIIESHGGILDYITKIGEETTFYFEIPLIKKD
ncbi:MAG: PAS domain S-box protein [Parachlamydiaceae bacterium]